MSTEKKENRVKLYGVVIGIVSLAMQHGIYLLANQIAQGIGIPPFLPKIEAIDGAIPIIPIFILPYVWAYAYWAMAPMAVSKCKLRHFLNYLASYLVACLIGAVILIFAPTYMDRVAEGLLDTSRTGPLYALMRFWYSLDGGEMAYNLFPSFHCINSTLSLLGVWGRPEIPKGVQIYSLVITVAIYLSTLFVKQHYVLDVISGILIAAVAYFVCVKWNWGRLFEKPIEWFGRLTRKAAPKAE